jgi:excinuclease ABC subunit A
MPAPLEFRSTFPGKISPPSNRASSSSGDGKFPGVRGFFEHLERKKYKLHVRVFLSRYRGYSVCSECSGLRLRNVKRAR